MYCPLVSVISTAPAATGVLRAHFDGLFNGDVSRLQQVFHHQARLTGVVRGEP